MSGWHSDPFAAVDRPHRVKARKLNKGTNSHKGMGHMRYRSFYGTKFNPFHSGWKSGSRSR